MVALIYAYRKGFGVERIWQQLPIAPSCDDALKARATDPERMTARTARYAAELRVCARLARESLRVRRENSVESVASRMPRRRAPHAREGVALGVARASGADHDPGYGPRRAARFGAAQSYDHAAERVVGVRLHPRRDVARFRVRRVGDRCVFATDCRLERQHVDPQ